DVYTELNFKTPLELLVATILSAQTTDKRVNLVTPTLFARYPTAADYAGADREELEKIIQPTGFYHAKATRLMGLAHAEREGFGLAPQCAAYGEGPTDPKAAASLVKPGPFSCPRAASRPSPQRQGPSRQGLSRQGPSRQGPSRQGTSRPRHGCSGWPTRPGRW